MGQQCVKAKSLLCNFLVNITRTNGTSRLHSPGGDIPVESPFTKEVTSRLIMQRPYSGHIS